MKYRGSDAVTCPNCDQLFFRLDLWGEARARIRCRQCHLEYIVTAKRTQRAYKILYESAVTYLEKTQTRSLPEIRASIRPYIVGQTFDGRKIIPWEHIYRLTQTERVEA